MNDPVMQSSSPRSSDSPSDSRSARAKYRSESSFWISIIVAALVAVGVRYFVAAPYIVSGSSMEPNFQDYNYLIVDKLTYDFSGPSRGDVIVLKLPEDTSRDLIKRVIGLPGDTVTLSGSAPTVTITNAARPQGITLNEPYVSSDNYGGSTGASYTLGPDQYFVLGDNRKVSADSRIWGILPKSDIIGRVIFRLYPFDELSAFPAQARYADSGQ